MFHKSLRQKSSDKKSFKIFPLYRKKSNSHKSVISITDAIALQGSKRLTQGSLVVSFLTCLVAVAICTWNLQITQAYDCLGQIQSFRPANNFAVGSIPGRVAVSDFNRDGKPDLAVTSPDSSFVAVFLGDGSGNFSSPHLLQAGNFSVPVATGDFNGDGKPDIAVGNREGTVWIYLGDGAGGFSGPSTFRDTNNGGEAYEMVVGDFNRDGKLDLAIGHQFSGLSILFGNGAGGFSLANEYIVGAGPVQVAAADFNNDGQLDLITANAQAHNVSLLLGSGSGGFAVSTLSVPPSGFGIADFNGDRNLDLVLGNTDNTSALLLLGDGRGGFGQPHGFPTGGSGPIGIVAADFNGDGKPDVAVLNVSSNNISILLSDGAGALGAPFNFAVGRNPVGIAVADLNLDGKPDLVAANYFDNNISVLLNDGYGVDLTPPVITAPDITVEAIGPAGAQVSYSVSAADNSGRSPSLSCNIPTGSTFPIGTTPVSCTATDACGNSTTANFNIIVIDTAPVLSLPDTIYTDATSTSGAAVNYVASAHDLIDGDRPITCSPASGSTFAVGETVVSCSSTDTASHTSTGTFSIFVLGTGQTATYSGYDIPVQSSDGGLSLTFSYVYQTGVTTIAPIDPGTIGTTPSGFAVSGVAYEINTTSVGAADNGVQLAFVVPNSANMSQSDFESLRVLHNNNGTLEDVTNGYDYPSRTVYAYTYSFSPFYLGRKVTTNIETLFDRSTAYKAGSTIPVKLRVRNAATNANLSSAALKVTARSLKRLAGSSAALTVSDSGSANPDSNFRYVGGNSDGAYLFNLSTKGLQTGSYALSFYVGTDRSFFYTVKFEVK
ncbi:MAG: FG-GAP-like repeat-containing protein [Pyrinomonadaceae bacterium]